MITYRDISNDQPTMKINRYSNSVSEDEQNTLDKIKLTEDQADETNSLDDIVLTEDVQPKPKQKTKVKSSKNWLDNILGFSSEEEESVMKKGPAVNPVKQFFNDLFVSSKTKHGKSKVQTNNEGITDDNTSEFLTFIKNKVSSKNQNGGYDENTSEFVTFLKNKVSNKSLNGGYTQNDNITDQNTSEFLTALQNKIKSVTHNNLSDSPASLNDISSTSFVQRGGAHNNLSDSPESLNDISSTSFVQRGGAKKKPTKKTTTPETKTKYSISREINKAEEIHNEVVKMIQDLGYPVDEAKIIKAGLYSYTKKEHPELNNYERALKMKSYTTKNHIANLDINAVKQAIKIKAENEKKNRK